MIRLNEKRAVSDAYLSVRSQNSRPALSSKRCIPTIWKRDEWPPQSIVIGGDNRLVTSLGITLLILQLGTTLCDISRYFKIDLHKKAPIQEALAKTFSAVEGIYRNLDPTDRQSTLTEKDPPARQCPIRSPLDPSMQVLEIALKVCLVVLPRQPIHAGCSIRLEFEERCLRKSMVSAKTTRLRRMLCWPVIPTTISAIRARPISAAGSLKFPMWLPAAEAMLHRSLKMRTASKWARRSLKSR